MEISVIGLGRLGSSFAASVANSGIEVSGADIDSDVVSALKENRQPFQEPHLGEYLEQASESFTATTDTVQAVSGTDISFIFVNTYHPNIEGYSLKSVEAAVRDVGRALVGGESPHLVVLRSTVMPGDTQKHVINWLETESNRTIGDDLHLCYWPELTALGEIIDSMESPEFRLVGEHSSGAGDRLEAFIESWRGDNGTLIRTDLTSAEVAKMAINTYIASKMSFVNNLSSICEGVGADVDEVTAAMACDSRINGKYFTAGVRYGGPCFPHDNVAFEALAERAGTSAPLARASEEVNVSHTDWIMGAIQSVTPSDGTVGVLGLTYKSGVPVVQESQGMELLKAAAQEYNIIAYDAIATKQAADGISEEVRPNIQFTDAIDTAVADVDTAVVTLREGKLSDPATYTDVTLVDPWRMFEADQLRESTTYLPLGRGTGR
jgi:UDPglucose 6-dehydrogenase